MYTHGEISVPTSLRLHRLDFDQLHYEVDVNKKIDFVVMLHGLLDKFRDALINARFEYRDTLNKY